MSRLILGFVLTAFEFRRPAFSPSSRGLSTLHSPPQVFLKPRLSRRMSSQTTKDICGEPACSPIVDVGVNLAHKSFQSNLPSILSRAFKSNVTHMVITGTTVQSSLAAQGLVQKYKAPCQLFFTAGVHPHYAKDCDEQYLAHLTRLLQNPHCVAVGETGLDFNRNFSPQAVQESVFEDHLKLAHATGKPLFCHEREAHRRFLEILDRHPEIEGSRICVHCFTGEREELIEYVRRGFFIGFTGCICDSKRGLKLRQLVPLVPLSQTLIETDAPFMMPTGGRGQNEPANLVAVLRTLAECHGVSELQAARATTANAAAFFRLPLPQSPPDSDGAASGVQRDGVA